MHRRAFVVPMVLVVAAFAAACGAERAPDQPTQAGSMERPATVRELGPRYGIAAALPAGWDGRLERGALHAASFRLAPGLLPWTPEAGERMSSPDVAVSIFEDEPRPNEPAAVDEYPELLAPLHLNAGDFEPFDGITEDSRATGHGFARRTFQLSGRFFVLFAEAGERVPSPSLLAALNELLASFTVESGDFFPGTVEPGRFPDRAGWFVGTSGEDEARAEGEWTTAWAATIPYANEWNELPPAETLVRLPRDGIVIWLGVSRSNRFPPDGEGSGGFPTLNPPFTLDQFDRRAGWEGQTRNLPEYVLWATVRRQYQVDLRVYFGRPDPTKAMLAEAQTMLEGLELPDWGPWETG